MERKQIANELVSVRNKTNQLQNLMMNKGLSSKIAPLTTEEAFLQPQKELASINEELSQNQHLINILVGRSPDTPLNIDQKKLKPINSYIVPKNLSLDLLARRPDLMAQIWRAKKWAYLTSAAMADFYPNINLVGLIGLQSVPFKKLFLLSSGTGSITPALHLPIFTAGAIRANVRAKYDLFKEAIFAYNDLLLKSAQEVLDVLAFAEAVNLQNKEQQGILESARERYQLITLRNKKGLDSLFAVYRQREEVLMYALTEASLRYDQYVAAIKLIKALGGGYHSHTIPLVKSHG